MRRNLASAKGPSAMDTWPCRIRTITAACKGWRTSETGQWPLSRGTSPYANASSMMAPGSRGDKAYDFLSSKRVRHRHSIAPPVLVVARLWVPDSRSGESEIDNGPAECEKPPGPGGAGARAGGSHRP
jgi:hypothetical protein